MLRAAFSSRLLPPPPSTGEACPGLQTSEILGRKAWLGSVALGFAFRGESRHRIDQKGRVSVPAEFRKGIICGDPDYQIGANASFTIVYGDSRMTCLKCYTEQSIREIDEAIELMDLASESRRFLEFFYQTKSFKAQLDPAGRFVLPAVLKSKTRINGDVWFAGTGASFEMWNLENYEAHCSRLEAQFRDGDSALDPRSLLQADL